MTSDLDSAPPPRDDAERAAVPRRHGRRAWRWLGGTFAALVLLVLATIAALLWALHDAGGSAWLLGRVPQLTVVGPRGSLIGDFAAERIEIAFPGSGVLRLDAPSWHALAASRGDRGRWLKLRIATLHAERVTWLASAAAPPGEPPRLPATLRVPVEVEVDAATVDELRIGDDDAMPLRMLKARVHVGAELPLHHHALLVLVVVLDRVFHRDDVPVEVLVDVVQHRRQRRRLARPGRPRHQEDPARPAADLLGHLRQSDLLQR